MSVQLYPLGKQALLGAVDLSANNVKVALLSNAYTYSAAHQFYSDVSGSSLGVSANLSSKTITNGVFDAADTSVVATATATVGSWIVYQDTGTAGTSPVILFYDGLGVITISAAGSTSAVAVDPLIYPLAASTVLTRTSGTGATSITLNASTYAVGIRALTASGSVTTVAGDTYTATISGVNLPYNVNNGQTVNLTFDNGTYRIFGIN